jgi:hypothetical protein
MYIVNTISKAWSIEVPRSPKTVGLNVLSERCSFSKTSIGRVLVLSLVVKKTRQPPGLAEKSGRQTIMGQPNLDSVDKQSIESFQTLTTGTFLAF